MGKHILILGGGFGGLNAALHLRNTLPSEHKITMVDRQPLFIMGLTKLWILNGTKRVGELSANRSNLSTRGVDFLEGEVTAIDSTKREVHAGKHRLVYDYLIIALGVDYSERATPGFAKYATNLYTESGCAEIRDTLQSLDSGKLTVLVCGLPFKCPPAPYEASMIIDDVLRKRGVRDKVKLQIVTPEAHPLTILGPEAGKHVTDLLKQRDIDYFPSCSNVEIQRNAILTKNGMIPHDYVFAIPVHVAPKVLKESGLTDESGWVPVDPSTLMTNHQGVYAVGDCAGAKIPRGQLLPRAGSLAERQGEVVAENIIREVKQEAPTGRFDGRGVCFMEVGGGKAVPVSVDFYAQPAPKWEFDVPSDEGYAQKQEFLRQRMNNWFS